MTDLVERLVPDELWVLFRRVVPPTEVIRPQGGGRRRHGDREVLAAIIFVATTGCTWRQLPPGFGPSGPTAHRRFTEWSRARTPTTAKAWNPWCAASRRSAPGAGHVAVGPPSSMPTRGMTTATCADGSDPGISPRASPAGVLNPLSGSAVTVGPW